MFMVPDTALFTHHVVNCASVIGISLRIIQNESPLTVIRALATMTPISLRAVHS